MIIPFFIPVFPLQFANIFDKWAFEYRLTRNNIYYVGSPFDFKEIKKIKLKKNQYNWVYDWNYLKTNENIYKAWVKLENVDAKSFQILNYYLSKDKNNIFFQNKSIYSWYSSLSLPRYWTIFEFNKEKTSFMSHRIKPLWNINYSYIKIDNQRYKLEVKNKKNLLTKINLNSRFPIVLGGWFFYEDWYISFEWKKLPSIINADKFNSIWERWEKYIINNSYNYWTDWKFVVYKNKIIDWADPKTFSVIRFDWYWKDKNNFYKGEFILTWQELKNFLIWKNLK